jgi:hypothetical protein
MTAVLAILLSIVAAGIVALVLRALFLGYPPPRLAAGSTLTRKEQALVAAAADALFPPDGPIPLSGTEAGLVEYMDASLRRVPAGQRALLRLLFVFLEHGPWIFGPRRARFTQLTPDDRVVALTDMAGSAIYFRRIAFLSLRTMLSMGYLANDAVARTIGMTSHASPFEVVADAASVAPVRERPSARPAAAASAKNAGLKGGLQPA